jgi:hypothetical protein
MDDNDDPSRHQVRRDVTNTAAAAFSDPTRVTHMLAYIVGKKIPVEGMGRFIAWPQFRERKTLMTTTYALVEWYFI